MEIRLVFADSLNRAQFWATILAEQNVPHTVRPAHKERRIFAEGPGSESMSSLSHGWEVVVGDRRIISARQRARANIDKARPQEAIDAELSRKFREELKTLR